MSSSVGRAGWATALAVAFVLGLTGSAYSETPEIRGEGGMTFFANDMDTTIYSPFASVGTRLPGEVDVDLTWHADAITSASVDVVTAATGQFTELRNEFALTAARENILEDFDVHGGYTYSFELDSFSHVGIVGARRGFSQDNLEIGAQYAFSYNRLGLPTDGTDLWHTLLANNIDVDAVIVLGPSTQLDVVYSGSWLEGYMQSPYRRVPINWRTDLRGAQWVDEETPDRRFRHGFTTRLRHTFGRDVLTFLDYRFYVDSWSVVGHTAQLKLAVRLGEDVSVAVRGRGSIQGAASFYRPTYEVPTEYRTRDRRLSSHISGMAGGSVVWKMGSLTGMNALNLRLAVDGVAFEYDDYVVPVLTPTGDATQETLGWVTGIVAQASVGVEL